MATDTVVISAPDVVAAPQTYTVPDAAEIVPLAVSAVFDGSGAGSAYLPTLVLVAPSGQVMARAIADATVAAGASAEVSWFPHVAAAAQGAPGPPGPAGTTPALVLYSSDSLNGDPSYDIPAYSGGIGGAISAPYWNAQQPSDTSWYSLHYQGPVAASPPYDSVSISAAGTYLATAYTKLVHSAADEWLAAQIITSSTNLVLTPEFALDAHLVHDATGGTPPMSEDGSDGSFYSTLPLVVATGKTGEIYVQVYHQANAILTIFPEQTLTIVKLA